MMNKTKGDIMTNQEAQNKIQAIRQANKIKIANKVYTVTNPSSGTFKAILLSGPRRAKKQILATSYGMNQDIISFRSQDVTRMDTKYFNLSQITIIA
jgi:basic membrane lipoprotein Med (substrate-binding protein (PBP1-ABC) superfamily)